MTTRCPRPGCECLDGLHGALVLGGIRGVFCSCKHDLVDHFAGACQIAGCPCARFDFNPAQTKEAP